MTVRREGIFTVAEMSYAGFLGEAWDTVLRALGVTGGPIVQSGEELAGMLHPWGSRPIGASCEYPSKVSRDGFPAEMSVNWSASGVEVRLLSEALGDPPGAVANQEAGLALLSRLEAQLGAYLGWFHKVSDLFLGGDPARFIWHSIACPQNGPVVCKVYLDAAAHGEPADELLAEVAGRLGFASAWQYLTQVLNTLTPRPELEYFALDLVDGPTARVKVYFRHRRTGLQQLDRLAAAAGTHRSELALPALGHLIALDAEVDNEPLTCIALRPDDDRPTQATTYLRIPGIFPTEQAASIAVAALMRHCGLDPSGYLAVVGALAPGRLADVTGLQELVSYRVRGAREDITVYLRFGVYPRQVNAF